MKNFYDSLKNTGSASVKINGTKINIVLDGTSASIGDWYKGAICTAVIGGKTVQKRLYVDMMDFVMDYNYGLSSMRKHLEKVFNLQKND